MGCLSAWMQGRSGSRRKSAWQACGAVNLLAGSLLAAASPVGWRRWEVSRADKAQRAALLQWSEQR